MPSILDYLGYPRPFVAFGNSIFQPEVPRFDMSMFSNSYQLIRGEFALQWDGADNSVVYNYKNDPLLTKQVQSADKETADSMMQLLKAIIQQYDNRMIDNRLTAPSTWK
jgi:hypothetical protein